MNAAKVTLTSAEKAALHECRTHGDAYPVIESIVAARNAKAWDEGHADGCIAAHCYMNRGLSFFDESKLTDCHTRNPYRAGGVS